MEANKNPAHEVVALEYVEMNGPVEVEMKVHCMVPDIRAGVMQAKLVKFFLDPGSIPAREKMQALLDSIMVPAAEGIPPGTRLMTKPEFIEHTTKRETGRAIPMPGLQEFVRAVDVPRDMLLHAVIGASNGDLPLDLPALSDAELMDIYRKKTHG